MTAALDWKTVVAAVMEDVVPTGDNETETVVATAVPVIIIIITRELLSEMTASLEFVDATVVRLPGSTVVATTPAESVNDDNGGACLGGGGGAKVISLEVISLNMVCQMTSVILANNTRYSGGKLYVIIFAGVQTLAFAISSGTNLACIWAGICRIGEPLSNAGIGISHTE